MIRKIITICLCFAVWTGMFSLVHTEAEQPLQFTTEDIYAMSHSSVFYLRNLGEYGTLRSVGTGVIISEDGYALTAYHVVENGVHLEAVLHDGRIIQDVKVEKYDEEMDIAMLKLPVVEKGATFDALPIRSEKVRYGEVVFAIGYPMKETPIITDGIVNAPDAKINGHSRILISAQIVSGMSGGPLIDQQGRVAGIVSGSLRTMPGIHLIAGIEQRLDSWESDFMVQ